MHGRSAQLSGAAQCYRKSTPGEAERHCRPVRAIAKSGRQERSQQIKMRRSQAAMTIKEEVVELKRDPTGPGAKAGVTLCKAEAPVSAATGTAAAPPSAQPKSSEADGLSPFPGFARPLPHECSVQFGTTP